MEKSTVNFAFMGFIEGENDTALIDTGTKEDCVQSFHNKCLHMKENGLKVKMLTAEQKKQIPFCVAGAFIYQIKKYGGSKQATYYVVDAEESFIAGLDYHQIPTISSI